MTLNITAQTFNVITTEDFERFVHEKFGVHYSLLNGTNAEDEGVFYQALAVADISEDWSDGQISDIMDIWLDSGTDPERNARVSPYLEVLLSVMVRNGFIDEGEYLFSI